MKSSKTTIFAALCLLLAALLSAGCFKGQANLSIHEDGSCTFKSTLLGTDFIRQAIDENKDELLKNDPNAKIREITEGDKKGFEVISEFPDMKTLAEKGGGLFARQDDKCLGVMEKKTWFYDAYALDLWVGSSDENTSETDPQAQAMMQSFLSQIQYEFRLDLPVIPESHNAETVEAEGKTLHWDLSPTLASQQEKHIKVEYRLWNKTHIALTAVLGLTCLVLAVVMLAMRQEDESRKRRNRLLAALFLVIALAIGAFSAYAALQPFTLTAQDSISPAASDKQSEK